MLVADTLTADLTFYENGDVAIGVERRAVAARRQRGRHDPLRARAPRAAAGRARDVRRLRRGRRRTPASSRWTRASRPSCCAEAVLEQRRRRRDGRVAPASPREGRRRRARQDRAAAGGARSRAPGTRSSAATSTRASSSRQRAARRRSRTRPGLDEALARGRRRRAAARGDRHDRGRRRGRRPRDRRAAAASSTTRPQPDWAILDAVVADIGAGLRRRDEPDDGVRSRRPSRSARPATRIAPALERAQRAAAPSDDFHVRLLPRAGLSAAGSSPTSRRTRSSSAA